MAAKKAKAGSDRNGPLQQALSRFSRASLLALLDAASCSPSASHRLPSIGFIFSKLLTVSEGIEVAQASDLESLLEVCRRVEPHLETVEDYLPSDGRLDVRTRWGNRLLRLMPGSLERPIAMIERARLVANCTDSVLIGRLGFGLTDACDLVLTHVDGACTVMASEWVTRAEYPRAPTALSDDEVTKASQILSVATSLAKCAQPDRAARALEWATTKAPKYAPVGGQASFGTSLRIRNGDGTVVPIPIGFWIEALDTIINELAGIAAETDARVESRFHADSSAELTRLLRRLNRPIRRNLPVPSGGRIHSGVAFDRNSIVVLDLASTLGVVDTQDAEERLEEFKADARDIVRVHVTSTSGHLIMSQGIGAERVVATTLDDVSWIVERCLKEPDDFFLFFKEFVDHPNVREVLTLETINAFEHWRANGKCLFQQGAQYHFALLAFHQGDKEWIEAARRTPLESALLRLGLSRIAKWDVASIKNDAADAMLGYIPTGPAWLVRVANPVVGIHCFDGSTPAESRQLLLSLAQGILWRIDKSTRVGALIEAAVGEQALKIWFEPRPLDAVEPVIRFLCWDGDRVLLGFDERLEEYCHAHSTKVELVIGEALAVALAQRGGERTTGFLAAWADAPAGFQMNAAALPVGSNQLPEPQGFNQAMESAASRTLATRLKDAGIEPREYVGRDATQLETLTICPNLLEMLAEVMAPFDAIALLEHALNQLERALCDAHVKKLKRDWDDQFPVIGYDSLKRHMSEERGAFMLVRSIRVVVEEVVRRPPAGNEKPLHFDWLRILGVADLYAQSGTRSETNHYGLVPMKTTISAMYDVEQREAGDSLLDNAAFHESKIRAGALPATETVTIKDLEPVAISMHEGEGFRPETVGLVLETISAWNVDPARAFATCSVDELIDACYHNRGREVERDEIRAAVAALSLNRADLDDEVLQHWEQERRKARLMTKPIVVGPDGRLRLLPWQANATWRVFQGYLAEGRCMWPAGGLSERFQKSLETFRDQRNRELERLVARKFKQVTPLVRANVKKAKVLGLTVDEWGNVGEIDCLAVDAPRRVVWVAEAKDLFMPFSPATMRRSYEKYFEPEKGYVTKLLKKTAMIERHLSKVLRAFECDALDGEWRVLPVMVTRRVEPSGFARVSAVPFCHVDQVVDFVQR
jgi:hypothetical protein